MVALGDADPYDRPRLYKLQAPLAKLDPCDKLAINDWLIKLKAAAGAAFQNAYDEPIPRSAPFFGLKTTEKSPESQVQHCALEALSSPSRCMPRCGSRPPLY